MVNRIDPMDQSLIGKVSNKVGDTTANRKVSGDAGTTDQAAASSVATSDTVELTNSAKLLERLEKTLASVPVVDDGRVDEIKAAIENGEYEIDPQAIADAMIRFERSFGD